MFLLRSRATHVPEGTTPPDPGRVTVTVGAGLGGAGLVVAGLAAELLGGLAVGLIVEVVVAVIVAVVVARDEGTELVGDKGPLPPSPFISSAAADTPATAIAATSATAISTFRVAEREEATRLIGDVTGESDGGGGPWSGCGCGLGASRWTGV
jgi:hypothetical protein